MEASGVVLLVLSESITVLLLVDICNHISLWVHPSIQWAHGMLMSQPTAGLLVDGHSHYPLPISHSPHIVEWGGLKWKEC